MSTGMLDDLITTLKLKTIPGWGHDLPLELVDELADAIADHAKANAG